MAGQNRAGRFDIADIVRNHRQNLEAAHPLTREQRRVLTDIANCRTQQLGGHIDRCVDCGYEHPSYNSCRNRHCPKCQALAQEKWISEQRARMLDVPHFHVVFTLPAQLRRLAACAPRIVFNALFFSAQRTLLEFGESRLKATLGATLVLHTWTRDLCFHPHVHAIVTGGGLARHGVQWKRAGRAFLFPVKLMSQVFRGKMLDELKRAYQAGHFAKISDLQEPKAFNQLLSTLYQLSWNVYAKRSFSKGEHVLNYLGRYTHRVGIANSRLLHVTDAAVCFRTKGEGKVTLSPVEFLSRFVQHVLPDGFHKIRHIGLYGSVDKHKLACTALGDVRPIVKALGWRERFKELTGTDVAKCPQCKGTLYSTTLTRARSPPEVFA